MIEYDHDLDDLLDKLLRSFEEKMPFNKLLGLRVQSLQLDEVKLRLDMRDELIGNFVQGMLHGGVIASILDVAGAMIVIANTFQYKEDLSEAERNVGFDKIGTIDIRVDYLRPGQGQYFIATSHLLRRGKRIAVARMELHNDQNMLIAVGIANYSIG